mmetsp:Transcript_9730/g.24617  ORF Transcript_9730/g.24617 Transcript_9730/m.24617 type:complete len:267 (+) Transcript_9730:402-1202(+)
MDTDCITTHTHGNPTHDIIQSSTERTGHPRQRSAPVQLWVSLFTQGNGTPVVVLLDAAREPHRNIHRRAHHQLLLLVAIPLPLQTLRRIPRVSVESEGFCAGVRRSRLARDHRLRHDHHARARVRREPVSAIHGEHMVDAAIQDTTGTHECGVFHGATCCHILSRAGQRFSRRKGNHHAVRRTECRAILERCARNRRVDDGFPRNEVRRRSQRPRARWLAVRSGGTYTADRVPHGQIAGGVGLARVVLDEAMPRRQAASAECKNPG